MSSFEKPDLSGTFKVAMFQSMTSGYFSIMQNHSKDEKDWSLPGYVRLTEWVEVSFPQLGSEEVIANALVVYQRERELVVNKFTKELANIDGQMANLRCLTAPVVES